LGGGIIVVRMENFKKGTTTAKVEQPRGGTTIIGVE
jgi:hypothetical protein